MNLYNFGDSLTFLHLHHGVEFVVHGEISTYWMDNHAIWCFTFVAFVHCVVLLWKHSSTSSRHFQSSVTFLKSACLLDGILLNSSSVDFGHQDL